MRLLLKSLQELVPDRKQCLETAVVSAAALVLYSLLSGVQLYGWIGFSVLILSLIFPKLFHPLAWLWFGLAIVLGWFSSRILLSLLFFLLVTPVAVMRRLLGKDSLMLRRFKNGEESVFISRNHKFTADDLKNPF